MAVRDRQPPSTQTPPAHQHPAIEVMVVDDSAVIRQRLKSIIESDPQFRVILAADPYEAVAMLSKSVPGVIVLDVEMPRMDGLTFLRKLMRQHPLPVVLCTAQAERAVKGLELGALDVVAKPDWRDGTTLGAWARDLRDRLAGAAFTGPLGGKDESALSASTLAPADSRHSADVVLPRSPYVPPPRGVAAERLIAVGVSTGGVQAVQALLSGLPSD